MVRRAAFLLGVASLLLALPIPTAAQENNPLKGAWVLNRIDPADGEVAENPGRGLLLLTDTHYSHMGAASASTRAELPEEPTDAEKARAFETFRYANSGPYEVRGDTITLRPYVAKYPYRMKDFPNHTFNLTYRLAGDTLQLTTPGGTSLFFRQVDDRPRSY